MSSIFTKIIDREFGAYIIDEDEDFISFLDINPLTKGHCLVVPKKEVDYFFDIGACWGVYSLRLGKKFNKLNIIAYDPIKKNI